MKRILCSFGLHKWGNWSKATCSWLEVHTKTCFLCGKEDHIRIKRKED